MVRFLAVLIAFAPRFVSPLSFLNESERLIVWNVGQGLWVTWVTPQTCYHFDMGGEFAPWAQIRQTCGARENRALFSHWDWDHIGFAKRASRTLEKFCILSRPRGQPTPFKLKLLGEMTACEVLKDSLKGITDLKIRPHPSRGASSNASSRVHLVKKLALLPGDSTSKEEKLWSRSLRHFNIRFLVLGHHGSKSSTSKALMKNLPRLRQAIASARQSRYGHPHKLVVNRLRKSRVALLKTEDWGTIHWEVPRPETNH